MTSSSRRDVLSPAGDWREAAFERDAYGPDERAGLSAVLEHPSGEMSIRVVPVRYERGGGEEQVRALTESLKVVWREPSSFGPDVPRQTAFATYVDCEHLSPEARRVACVARDAGDALAAAVWLTRADDPHELARHVRIHRGEQPSRTAGAVVSDDDALAARFAGEADRCLLTGKPTRSHPVTVPYRYVLALERVPTTGAGVVRFPARVHSLGAVVSHGAWAESDLDEVPFGAPVERESAGTYRLDARVVDVVADADPSRLALRHLGGA